MRRPLSPPDLEDVMASLSEDKLSAIMMVAFQLGPAPNGEYLHWDKLRYKEPPKGLTHEEWWCAVKSMRMAICNKNLPLHDEYDTPFFFAVPDGVLEKIHKIDRDASGQLRADSGVNELLNSQSRNSYLKSSLADEAITSSQLEGASTTKVVAKEMLSHQLYL